MTIRLILESGRESWLVNVPDDISLDVIKYQKQFDCFIAKNKVSFGLEDFTNWLDDYVLKERNQKLEIISTDDNPFDDNYNPVINRQGEKFIVTSIGKPMFKTNFPILHF